MIELHPEFSRALLEALSGGVAFIDRADRVQWANPEFAALLGTDRRRLIGRAAGTLPFPLRDSGAPGEQVTSVGELLVIERTLTAEPLVGRLLQLLPRKPIQSALPASARVVVPEMPVPSGVLSREIGLQRLATEISRSRRYENPLSCLVGRTEGYDPSATLRGLETLLMLLKEQLRWVDVLVHWGADRVLVLLPETNSESAFRLQRKLSVAVDAGWPADVTDVRVHWGCATWRRGDDATRLVRRAEAASLAPNPHWTTAPR